MSLTGNNDGEDLIGFPEQVENLDDIDINIEQIESVEDSCSTEVADNMEPLSSQNKAESMGGLSPETILMFRSMMREMTHEIGNKIAQTNDKITQTNDKITQGLQKSDQNIQEIGRQITQELGLKITQNTEKLEETKQEIAQVRQELISQVEIKLNTLKGEMNDQISACNKEVEHCEKKVEKVQAGLASCEKIIIVLKENLECVGQEVLGNQGKISTLQENIRQVHSEVGKNQNDITELHIKVNEKIRDIEMNEREIQEVKESFVVNVEKVLTENDKIGNKFEKFRDEIGRECLKKVEEKLSKIKGDSNGGIRSTVLTVDEVNTFEKTVPKFYGDNRGATPIQFITKCDKVLGYLKGSDEQQIELFVTKLEGSALQWGMQKENEWRCFSDAKQAFLDKYWGVYIQDDFLQYLFSGRHRGRDGPMAHYVQSLYAQAKYLSNPISNERFISHVVHHFNRHVQNCILGLRAKTVEEVVALLETLDRRDEREEGLRGREIEYQGRPQGPHRERIHQPGNQRQEGAYHHRQQQQQERQGNERPPRWRQEQQQQQDERGHGRRENNQNLNR